MNFLMTAAKGSFHKILFIIIICLLAASLNQPASAQQGQRFIPDQGEMMMVGCSGIVTALSSSYQCRLYTMAPSDTTPQLLSLPELTGVESISLLTVDMCPQDGRIVLAAASGLGIASFGGSALDEAEGNIYIADNDGQNVEQITDSLGDNRAAIWSPDCEKIVFHSNRDGNYQIYLINPDGTGLQRLTNNSSRNRYPFFSSDGQTIYFQANASGIRQVYRMNLDGTGVQSLTSDGENHGPVPSPDGRFIAFASNRDNGSVDQLYVMRADGSSQVQVLASPTSVFPVTWSPDSQQLVFHDFGREESIMYVYNIISGDLRPVVWDFFAVAPFFAAGSAGWWNNSESAITNSSSTGQSATIVPAEGTNSNSGADSPVNVIQALEIGDTINAQLRSGDSDGYTLDVDAGDMVQINLNADFDTYLEIRDPSGAIINYNDDFGGYDSQITHTFSTSGTYLIVARGYSRTASGAYELTITDSQLASASSSSTSGTIELNETINAVLGAGNQDRWTFNAQGGESIQINMNADFDTYLEFYNPNGIEIASNDDFIGFDSQINVVLSAAGAYTIVARAFSDGVGGPYELTVTELAASGGTIDLNDSISAILSSGNEDRWTFTVQGGESLQINMNADFDTYLRLYDPSGIEIASNDDFNGFDSQINVVLSGRGTYTIAASSFGGGGIGESYTLIVATQ